MKQDISLQCPRLPGNLRCLERREEAQITEHHQHEVFFSLFGRFMIGVFTEVLGTH